MRQSMIAGASTALRGGFDEHRYHGVHASLLANGCIRLRHLGEPRIHLFEQRSRVHDTRVTLVCRPRTRQIARADVLTSRPLGEDRHGARESVLHPRGEVRQPSWTRILQQRGQPGGCLLVAFPLIAAHDRARNTPTSKRRLSHLHPAVRRGRRPYQRTKPSVSAVGQRRCRHQQRPIRSVGLLEQRPRLLEVRANVCGAIAVGELFSVRHPSATGEVRDHHEARQTQRREQDCAEQPRRRNGKPQRREREPCECAQDRCGDHDRDGAPGAIEPLLQATRLASASKSIVGHGLEVGHALTTA